MHIEFSILEEKEKQQTHIQNPCESKVSVEDREKISLRRMRRMSTVDGVS